MILMRDRRPLVHDLNVSATFRVEGSVFAKCKVTITQPCWNQQYGRTVSLIQTTPPLCFQGQLRDTCLTALSALNTPVMTYRPSAVNPLSFASFICSSCLNCFNQTPPEGQDHPTAVKCYQLNVFTTVQP